MPLIPQKLAAAFPERTLAAVGGSVRDHISRIRTTPDLDCATTLPPEDMAAALTAAGIAFSSEHVQFGVLYANLPQGRVDITSTRTETYTPGNRFPRTWFNATFAEDARRRDFTFNAVYMFPDGSLFDPVDGVEDLRNGIVRFVDDPARRLQEDPLRLYRFARFCGHYGLKGWTGEVHTALRAALPLLVTLPPHRVMDEMSRIRRTPNAAAVLSKLAGLGL